MRLTIITCFLLAAMPATMLTAQETPRASKSAPANKMSAYKELFEISQRDKKGLAFWVGGQVIGGVVVQVGNETVEIRNREYGRIVIALDRIDAVGIN